ncbi:dTDP-4-dehydrorhamnose 3,5-epimerase [Paraherbaspirillum soli]|uniref:dTDP-4-dehydrorhamnose 3,5-epimerase n=1 Tax=Paraherbaspirillum soli TaxID=631222 RepID=A0ABW0MGU5_9BURK
MKAVATDIPEVLIFQPQIFSDARGLFWESFNERRFFELTGIKTAFVQDNHTKSVKDSLRGLHYQLHQPQGKLVRVVSGEIFDVAVDLRKSSPTFGRWVGAVLSAENRQQMWVPAGFAHGFVVQSESAEILYKVTDFYAPEYERTIRWNDPSIGIEWPIGISPLLSAKDQAAGSLTNAEVFA